jgi:hypothetical protein
MFTVLEPLQGVVRTDVLFVLAQRGTIRLVLSGVKFISSAHSVAAGMKTLGYLAQFQLVITRSISEWNCRWYVGNSMST